VPQVADYVEQQRSSLSHSIDLPENEKLFLPSDFTESDRERLGLLQSATDERRLLEGSAYDVLHRLRTIIKGLNITRDDKKKNARGQVANTRAKSNIKDIELQRDLAISEYNFIRNILLSLGVPSDDIQFRPLTLQDTQMKRADIHRQLGDTHRTDGFLWTNTGISTGTRHVANMGSDAEIISANEARAAVATQGSKAKKRAYGIDTHLVMILTMLCRVEKICWRWEKG
jgi:hypothetical protein